MYLWPQFQGDVRHTSSSHAGLQLVPLLLGSCVSSLAADQLMWLGFTRVIRLGAILILIATLLLIRLPLVPSR
ncbi:hypothetical protein DSO57_1018491 [Entomophthora muscae]|uniref:Uncharacterized protein n=2 Tax=Entomophthora muscae TaxID=34485 RepID=A0ACC2TR89_9FUNG|nr:hypothetical protein DSO57_1034855 [Entomophthora muscae]KAJ9077259.1 hypothetical protein DSO57_1018491 [Entomophthora muscae]